MPNFFLTFRAHVSEPQVFEDFFTIFKNFLEKEKKYSYQIEWDDTPQRHIHVIVYDYKDVSKLQQKFNTKHYKLFKDSLQSKLTNWLSDSDNHGFCKIIRCNDEDPLGSSKYYLGYINKHNCSRRGQRSITDAEICDAVQEYYTNKKLSKREEKNNDIKLITPKNIYSNIISFVKNQENDTSYNDPALKYKTVKYGHFGYSQVSAKVQAQVFTELRIMNDCENEFDRTHCSLEAVNNENPKESEQYQELDSKYKELQKDMERILSSDDPQFVIHVLQKKYNIY